MDQERNLYAVSGSGTEIVSTDQVLLVNFFTLLLCKASYKLWLKFVNACS